MSGCTFTVSKWTCGKPADHVWHRQLDDADADWHPFTDAPAQPTASGCAFEVAGTVCDQPESSQRHILPLLGTHVYQPTASVPGLTAALASELRQAAVNWHDFGRDHQPGPRSKNAAQRVFFSQCEQAECVERRRLLALAAEPTDAPEPPLPPSAVVDPEHPTGNAFDKYPATDD